LELKCTKFDFGWSFDPDPAEGPTAKEKWEGRGYKKGKGEWRK